MTTLKLNVNFNAQKNQPVSDRPGEAALLSFQDVLEVKLGTGWASGVGISRIDVYNSSSGKAVGGGSTMNWTAASGTSSGLSPFFSCNGVGSGPTYTQVTMEDFEQNPAKDDPHWFMVTMSNQQKLDPEVINKAGTGGGRWVPATSG